MAPAAAAATAASASSSSSSDRKLPPPSPVRSILAGSLAGGIEICRCLFFTFLPLSYLPSFWGGG